jgi:mRNA interferase MazF
MKPGTVVVVNFDGATGVKRRPAVVVSTETYNKARPDIIVALITSRTAKSNEPSDHIIEHWAEAGLDRSSAVRTYLQTYSSSRTRVIGKLSEPDWRAFQKCLRFSIES